MAAVVMDRRLGDPRSYIGNGDSSSSTAKATAESGIRTPSAKYRVGVRGLKIHGQS